MGAWVTVLRQIRPAADDEFRAGRSEGPLCCVGRDRLRRRGCWLNWGPPARCLGPVPVPSGRYRDTDLSLGTPRVVRRRGVL